MSYQNWTIGYADFNRLGKKLLELGEGAEEAAVNALEETAKYVTQETEKAMASSPHDFNRTGETKKLLIKNPEVIVRNFKGRVAASVGTGFRLRDDSGRVISLVPIYLMYGTPNRKNPVQPDSKLKNAVKGEGLHRVKINQIQQDEFNKVIKRVMEKQK